MSLSEKPSRENYLDIVIEIIERIIEPQANEIDQRASFPRPAIEALGEAGILGLISGKEVGGMGYGFRAAVEVIEKIGSACASTAMVVCMHYCAVAVIEKYGPRKIREDIARGNHLSTLALSETGSRTHFWIPLSTATKTKEGISLDAQKSWATSSGQVDSYVWSSKPLEADGLSTIWLVPGKAKGLSIPSPFDGLGLRGNHSSPVTADNVLIPESNMLGRDGDGFEIMMDVILPHFLIINAASSMGIMSSAMDKTIAYSKTGKLEHLGLTLAEMPQTRIHLAKMRIKTDMVRALLYDTVTAVEQHRDDSKLRILEVKAAASEISTEVTGLAMRVCGGSAFRKEIGIERNFRDARAATIMSPTSDILYDFIGRDITDQPLL